MGRVMPVLPCRADAVAAAASGPLLAPACPRRREPIRSRSTVRATLASDCRYGGVALGRRCGAATSRPLAEGVYAFADQLREVWASPSVRLHGGQFFSSGAVLRHRFSGLSCRRDLPLSFRATSGALGGNVPRRFLAWPLDLFLPSPSDLAKAERVAE